MFEVEEENLRVLGDFMIKRQGQYSFWRIERQGRGKLPAELSGEYTDTRSAASAIKAYTDRAAKVKAEIESKRT